MDVRPVPALGGRLTNESRGPDSHSFSKKEVAVWGRRIGIIC